MKIGIDIRTLMDAQYSGIPEYTLNLIKEILKLDKKNKYKLFYNSGRDLSGRMPEFTGDNVEIIGARYPNKIFNYAMQKILHKPKIDKLLGVDIFLMSHINFIALSGKCRSILTIHDLSFLRYPEFFSFRKNFWHGMINIKKLAGNFDQVIAVSENTKQDIVELCGISPEKIKVIYSGIGRQYRKIDNNAGWQNFTSAQKKYNLPKKFILYLGTLEPRKNVEGVIQAYNELRIKNRELAEVKLVIAGGNGWKVKNIFKEWKKSEYKNDIQFLGYVGADDKIYLYNLAALFVYPSFYEGFGFPPLEAMACGIPVVCSSVSSLPEVAGEAAIMADPYNIAEIASSMEQILTDHDLQNNLINKGLEQAKRFSWKKTAEKYLEAFGSLS